MFGNLTDSVNMIDENTLKSNVPSKFTGGFKQASILKNSKLVLEERDKKEANKLDVFTVYD